MVRFRANIPRIFATTAPSTTSSPIYRSRENLQKWRRLEQAKHRVLYDIERIGLPILTGQNGNQPALMFEFKAAGKTPVWTGHASGVITIDIVEADSVRREQTRVQFGELQRNAHWPFSVMSLATTSGKFAFAPIGWTSTADFSGTSERQPTLTLRKTITPVALGRIGERTSSANMPPCTRGRTLPKRLKFIWT